MPAYNGERYIGIALDSVLAQSESGWEVIVVVDGATDRTEEIARDYASGCERIQVLVQANGGAASARNAGLSRISPGSKYVMFLDADDMLEPTALKTLGSLLDSHPAAPAAAGRTVCVDSDGCPIRDVTYYEAFDARGDVTEGAFRRLPAGAPLTFAQVCYHNYIATPGAALIRREVLIGAGGFAVDWRNGEDWDLWWRIALKHGNLLTTGEPIIRYRLHPSNKSRHASAARAAMFRFQRNLLTHPDLTPAQRVVARRAYLFSIVMKLHAAAFWWKHGKVKKGFLEIARLCRGLVRFASDSCVAIRVKAVGSATQLRDYRL